MGFVLIVFSSSTTAGRLKRLALRFRMSSLAVVQTPRVISENGCTYALRCGAGDLPTLLRLANDYGLRYSGIYREYQGADGSRTYEPYR